MQLRCLYRSLLDETDPPVETEICESVYSVVVGACDTSIIVVVIVVVVVVLVHNANCSLVLSEFYCD